MYYFLFTVFKRKRMFHLLKIRTRVVHSFAVLAYLRDPHTINRQQDTTEQQH